MYELDCDTIIIEFLKAVRGRRSQAQFNKRLGLPANKIHRWEKGSVSVSWGAFVRICEREKLPLGETCRRVFMIPKEPHRLVDLVRLLTGAGSQRETALKLGVSRSMISRWRSGAVAPDLSQVLQLIDASLYSLPEFMGSLVDPAKLPSLKRRIEAERRERALHALHPWIAALLLLFRTVEYNNLGRHREGWVGAKLGLTLAEERRLLKEMEETGVIFFDEKGLYEPAHRTLSTVPTVEGLKRIHGFWTEKAADLIAGLREISPKNKMSYMVLNANSETLPLILERYRSFYQDVHNIITASVAPSESVYVMNFHLMDFTDLMTAPPR